MRDRKQIYNDAFESVAYHTQKYRNPEPASSRSSRSASSPVTPDLKHTPLRDLEALLQVTRGNYDYSQGFVPTRTRREYDLKLNQFLRLQNMTLRKLWDSAAILWQQAKGKMTERALWDRKTEGFIPPMKYAATSTLSKLYAYTQGNYTFNAPVNKSQKEYHAGIQEYMDQHHVTIDELWEAAEQQWA